MDITNRKNSEIELLQLKENLEIQINDKTRELQKRVNELERFHEATIEREFRIKELRDEIERLKSERL
jgi:predicted  nucleic acid-binding Zn-ribbon protein